MEFPTEAPQLVLLLILYTIQAVPLGLSSAVPLLLQARHVPYSELAIYSFASLPFSLKLLWAPIVDSTHLPGLGRRKSWLIPTQLACGILMLLLGQTGLVASWIGEGGAMPRVLPLTILFFSLYLMMATQDIAVDGWALEILPSHKKKHASTCNTIGQTIGFYISNIGLLVFNDADTCNRFFRVEPRGEGLISVSGFFSFWGVIILLVTAYVALMQPEQPQEFKYKGSDDRLQLSRQEPTDAESSSLAVKDSYYMLWQLICLRPVQLACLVLLTSRIGFAATDATGILKMIEVGIKKENMVILAPLVMPWGVVSSYVTGRLIGRSSALSIFRFGWGARLLMVLIWMGVFKLTRDVYVPYARENGGVTVWAGFYWILLYVCVAAQQMCTEMMFVSQMAFFAQISDTSIGGSSMTFFNTMANLGNKWPGMTALAMLDRAGIGRIDAFIVESFVCVGLGLVWFRVFGRKALRHLERAPASAWSIAGPIYDIELQTITSKPKYPRGKAKHRRPVAHPGKEGL